MIGLLKQIYGLKINTTFGAVINMLFVTWLIVEKPWVWLLATFMAGGAKAVFASWLGLS